MPLYNKVYIRDDYVEHRGVCFMFRVACLVYDACHTEIKKHKNGTNTQKSLINLTLCAKWYMAMMVCG